MVVHLTEAIMWGRCAWRKPSDKQLDLAPLSTSSHRWMPSRRTMALTQQDGCTNTGEATLSCCTPVSSLKASSGKVEWVAPAMGWRWMQGAEQLLCSPWISSWPPPADSVDWIQHVIMPWHRLTQHHQVPGIGHWWQPCWWSAKTRWPAAPQVFPWPYTWAQRFSAIRWCCLLVGKKGSIYICLYKCKTQGEVDLFLLH